VATAGAWSIDTVPMLDPGPGRRTKAVAGGGIVLVPTVEKGSNKGRGKGKGETERVRESQKPRPAHGGLGQTQATAVINRVRQPVCVVGSYIMSDLSDEVSLNYVIANPQTPLDPPTHTPHH